MHVTEHSTAVFINSAFLLFRLFCSGSPGVISWITNPPLSTVCLCIDSAAVKSYYKKKKMCGNMCLIQFSVLTVWPELV